MVRPEIQKLLLMGPLPAEETADVEELKEYELLLDSIKLPVSDEELEELTKLFGTDTCYGLAWTLLNLIESAQNWPRLTLSKEKDNEWIKYLIERRKKFWDI